MLILLMTVMTLLLLLGFPMFVPLITGALVTLIIYFPAINPLALVQQTVGGVQSMSLIAVPMFIFAADLMTSGQVAKRLLNFVIAFTGHKRGGLPIATSAACTLFGAVSGSTQATVVAIGGPMRPMLINAGYSPTFSTALVINAAVIALLIPPSVYMIVYGVVSGTSVVDLFIAGVGPGLLIFLFFAIYCWFISDPQKILPKVSWHERFKALKEAALSFTFPVIIFGGNLFRRLQPDGSGSNVSFVRVRSGVFLLQVNQGSRSAEDRPANRRRHSDRFYSYRCGTGFFLDNFFCPNPQPNLAGLIRGQPFSFKDPHDPLNRLFHRLHVC